MHVINLLSVLSSVAVSLASLVRSPGAAPLVCGSPPPSEEYLAQIQKVAKMEKMGGIVFNADEETIDVRVFFHVVASSETEEGGWVSVGFLPDISALSSSSIIETRKINMRRMAVAMADSNIRTRGLTSSSTS